MVEQKSGESTKKSLVICANFYQKLMSMQLRKKHLIYLTLAIFLNILFLLIIGFHDELLVSLGKPDVVLVGFITQVLSIIIMIFGISFMLRSLRKSSSFWKSSSFYFWLFATTLAFIPAIYYMFV